MQLVPLNDSPTTPNDPTASGQLTSIASAVQNVCNATLSLLFTISLFIWGCFVNRKQAWRTDGGTAAFGIGALMLALVSTVITFIYIPSKDHYSWMPGLMWAVILWQSFLGWWWWVGSGMGVGEVDEILRREEKRRKKRKARLMARQARKERARTFWKGVTGALGYDRDARRQGSDDTGAEERREGSVRGVPPSLRTVATTHSEPGTPETSAAGSSVVTNELVRRMRQYPATRHLHDWYLRLRHAHLTASREQAEENVEKIQQVYGREGVDADMSGDAPVDTGQVGWGLGSYGIRQRRDDGERTEGLRGILEAEGEEEREEGGSEASSLELGNEPREGTEAHARRRKNRVARRESDARGEGVLPQHFRAEEETPPSSIWYWGPLRRWRLRDSTVYA